MPGSTGWHGRNERIPASAKICEDARAEVPLEQPREESAEWGGRRRPLQVTARMLPRDRGETCALR